MSKVSEPTFDHLASIIEAKLRIPRDLVKPDIVLRDIEIDSIALIEVALAAEDEFGTEISTDEIDSDGTVQDLYDLVLASVNGTSA